MKHTKSLVSAVAGAMMMAGSAASAHELHFTCYQDGNECDVLMTLLKKFEAKNPDITIKMELVPYQAILNNLPVQLAAGTGPDFAKVTDLGGLNKYYLDLSPYVNKDYWTKSFGKTLDWYRAGPKDAGIYGLHTQLTITGPYINKTLFDQAKVDVPKVGSTWAEWAAAADKVAKATKTKFPMAMDRSGHRFAGIAIPYGAKYFDADGNPELSDAGFAAAAKQFVDWNNDGTMDKAIWAGGSASTGEASKEFINGDLVYYYSGSWNTQKFASSIGDAFDWEVAPPPCGPGGAEGCSGMPGGAGLVAFKETKYPDEVAKVLDFVAQADNYAELEAKSLNIPAHTGVAAAGVKYEGASPAAAKALNAWAAQVPTISPVAFAYQGYKNNRAMFNITVTRVVQAITGEMPLSDALAKMGDDLKQALAAAKN